MVKFIRTERRVIIGAGGKEGRNGVWWTCSLKMDSGYGCAKTYKY